MRGDLCGARAARSDQTARTRNAELERAHADLERLHERLVQQEKLSSIGLLAAGVAHEINNPMAYVTTDVELLAEDLDDVLPAVLDGVQRVNTIVRDLRRFARGEPGTVAEYDLNREVRAALRMSEREIETRGRLEVAFGAVPPVLGRREQTAQVILNLAINAAHAIKEGGTVRISTRSEGDYAIIEVSDDGVGMTKEVQENLFEPFFTTKSAGQGTGLGLSVAHGIVTSQGGSITVESSPGRGATFTVYLPISAESGEASSELVGLEEANEDGAAVAAEAWALDPRLPPVVAEDIEMAGLVEGQVASSP